MRLPSRHQLFRKSALDRVNMFNTFGEDISFWRIDNNDGDSHEDGDD